MTSKGGRSLRGGVSAIELVLVVVILGLLAALAIPRFSRAGQSSAETEVRERLMVLRTAIEMYHRDHGEYPCGDADFAERSDFAVESESPRMDCFAAQLTKFTSKSGALSERREGPFVFGPYLRGGVPASPLTKAGDARARVLVVSGATEAEFQRAFPQADWVYNCDTGAIAANSDTADSTGKRYDQY